MPSRRRDPRDGAERTLLSEKDLDRWVRIDEYELNENKKLPEDEENEWF